YNVPARRKFLKSTATESAHVGEAVMLAALARPEVSFVLARDGKAAREYLRVASHEELVRQALAEDRLARCRAERGPMRPEAFLAPPERSRAGAVALHIFVNGRPVASRALSRAVAQGYGSVLEPGRYPVGVVYIAVPLSTVDVNVHPQKAEVRFTDARALYDAMTRELYAALSNAFPIPALGPPSRPWLPPRPTPAVPEPWAFGGVAQRTPGPATMPSPAPDPTPSLFVEGAGFYGQLSFLAQVKATFLVCEGPDALYVIDQH